MAAGKRKVAMSLMAHPDDAEILAGGTLALLAEKGWEIHIVSMTPGDCGTADLGPEQIARIRRGEAAAAAGVIGAQYHCLEARDLYVTFDQATLRRAMSVTRHISPTLVFTHSLNCYMMDHEVSAQIARSVSFGFAIPNTTTGPIAVGAEVPHLYYADAIEGTDAYGQPIDPSTYVDISRSMETKTRMLKAHASQRQWLLKHHGMDHYVQVMRDWSAKRGAQAGVQYAEGFRQHRGHPYPSACVLAAELGSLVTRASQATPRTRGTSDGN